MSDSKAADPVLAAIAQAEALMAEADETDDDDEPEEETPQRGEVIASIFRSGKREQLRVVHDTWNGCEFATLRIWFRDPEDRRVYLATRRGVTIRRREFPEVLKALHEIGRRLNSACPICESAPASAPAGVAGGA